MSHTNEQLLPHARLLFTAQAPSIEDCWCQGYQGFIMDEAESGNPYQKTSSEHQAWNDGWWNACLGEEPLFPETLEKYGLDADAALAHALPHERASAPINSVPEFLWFRRLCEVGLALLAAMLCVELAEMAF